MALTQEEILKLRNELDIPQNGISVASPTDRRRKMVDDLDDGTEPTSGQAERPGFFSRVKEKISDRLTGYKDVLGETKKEILTGDGELAETPVGTGARLAVRTGGLIGGSIGDVFVEGIKSVLGKSGTEAAKKVLEKTVTEPLSKTQEFKRFMDWSEKHPKAAKDIEDILMSLDIVPAFKGASKAISGTTKLTKRVFNTALTVPQRVANVRKAIGSVTKKIQGKAIKDRVKDSLDFANNPVITGAIDDIKIMVGLPESALPTDLTFRAIKPRIIKGKNLSRVKSQMALANKTIAENGLKPSNLKEYADAIFDTKKSVWRDIESRLSAGQAANSRVDLSSIALDILEKSEDSALLSVNPKASKQLVEIAENLVSHGDDVDILTAERIKQFLNADLGDAFGATDLSKQAKEAKKFITREIGVKLDNVLSDISGEFKDLKIKYGSLSSIEDDVLKRLIVFERQNPEGLADILTKTEAAAEIAFGGTKGRLKGIARLTMAKRLKKANNADELIRRAFNK